MSQMLPAPAVSNCSPAWWLACVSGSSTELIHALNGVSVFAYAKPFSLGSQSAFQKATLKNSFTYILYDTQKQSFCFDLSTNVTFSHLCFGRVSIQNLPQATFEQSSSYHEFFSDNLRHFWYPDPNQQSSLQIPINLQQNLPT